MTTCKISQIISPAFYDAHRAIKAGLADELLAEGGRGSAESSFVGIELPLLLLQHPECHAVAMRKVGDTLRNSVYAQICWGLSALGMAHLWHCTVSPMECTYKPTGQKIYFRGLDNPDKIKSIKVPFGYIGALWFEELDQFSGPEEIRNIEQSCLRGGPFSFTFKSFNPPASARNWANQYARETRPGKLIHHSTYLTTPVEWLGPRFLADAERLREKSETAYRHEYLGEVVGSGSAVFENLRIEPIDEKLVRSFDRRYHGVDWGWYPDPWAYNACAYDAGRRVLYLYDELQRLRTSNQDTGRLLLDRGVCRDPDAGEYLTADSAEEKSCGDYRTMGLPCRGAEKGPGSVNAGVKWLQSLDAIVIDPGRCPETAREFSEYEYERDKRTGEVLPGYPDANNHHIDAVRYALERVWKRRGA